MVYDPCTYSHFFRVVRRMFLLTANPDCRDPDAHPGGPAGTGKPDGYPPPSDMALQLADMNPDYSIKDRSVMISPEVTRLAQGLGWRQGYFVLFYRLDKDKDDQTFVRQSINIFPIENMNKVFTIEKEEMKSRSAGSGTFREMPFPTIGDTSIAFRGSNDNDPYEVGVYSVIFTKKDVYEKITMSGTTTDYETFKDIALKAAEKIR